MQKILITTCLVLCLAGSAFGQRHKVSVSFFKDGKKVVLKDDFKIYIVLQDSLKTTVIKPVIKNNGFVMPICEKYDRRVIVFQYKGYLLDFERDVHFKGSMSYRFGIDQKPFTKEHRKDIKQHKLNKIQRIHYLKPYIKDDGIVETIFVPNIKRNNLQIMKLIK
ncbi:hypothetical protein [uncultured Microscilla sp.]|uniref:hypothetical protein n=1 Tax=uncultured Microscilla sp. TaxID=432653 RepID=UPI002616FC3E|nr:hypothetical protein [uncultured Microscilla sp.]